MTADDNPPAVVMGTETGTPGEKSHSVYDELRRGKTELALAEEIRIALPTERETGLFWQ